MSITIKMPALSPTMTEGTLAKWLVAEGEEVRSGDVIAEIETDKATMEVESVDDGVMAKIVIAAGSQNVAVGAVIALLAEEGKNVSSLTVLMKRLRQLSSTGPCTRCRSAASGAVCPGNAGASRASRCATAFNHTSVC